MVNTYSISKTKTVLTSYMQRQKKTLYKVLYGFPLISTNMGNPKTTNIKLRFSQIEKSTDLGKPYTFLYLPMIWRKTNSQEWRLIGN